jgi:hypothetical protein
MVVRFLSNPIGQVSMDFKPKKKSNGKLNSGSAIIQSLFENKSSPLSEQFIRWKIWYSWSDYVGVTMANCCLPVGYDRGTLFVWVKNSTWMHHLQFLKETLQEQINSKLGKPFVKRIRLTLNRNEVPNASDPEWQKFIDNILKGDGTKSEDPDSFPSR